MLALPSCKTSSMPAQARCSSVVVDVVRGREDDDAGFDVDLVLL